MLCVFLIFFKVGIFVGLNLVGMGINVVYVVFYIYGEGKL